MVDPPGISMSTKYLDHRKLQDHDSRRTSSANNNPTTDETNNKNAAVSVKPIHSSPHRRAAITPEEQRRSNGNFAVQSIRRGTQEWYELVRPFVADLAFCSVVTRHFNKRRPLFRPFTTQAAVLFVDISGYSSIAARLADRGAHALSSAVNSYLRRILQIVHQHGGDIVKFAGDAVLCLWYDSRDMASAQPQPVNVCSFISNIGHMDDTVDETLRYNILSAALCAVELQKQAGSHAVDGTDQEFRIHAGLCHGIIESEIFVAPNHNTMQRMYHLVGGEALEKIGDLVEYAKAGQVCVSAEIHRCLETFSLEGTIVANFQPATGYHKDVEEPQLLIDLTISNVKIRDVLENFGEEAMIARINKRIPAIAEDFIHPAVLDLLSHGGLSPTQIAQMRDLVVLFIAQTSHGSPANWLLEVQAVLDRNQCPLLQIVDDDKGVHAIAAVNAVAAVPESRLASLEICRQLVHQKIGVAIGVAAGTTFCGVTGSSSVACRWDITGEPPVRAARLMQYALKKKLPMALDESLCIGPTIPARMALLEDAVPIKGSHDPVRIYTLSDATEFAAMNLLESVHGDMHNRVVDKITRYISGSRHRSAVIVSGPTLAGKKM